MIKTYSDGGARGNPGPAAIGVVVYDGEKIVKKYKEFLGHSTNNRAEYKGVINALKIAKRFGKEIICYLDSELVVKQLDGEYKIRDKHLLEFHNELKKIEKDLDGVKYRHVRREDECMQEADRLVNVALDENMGNIDQKT